jgi:hypothetical protein
MQVRVGWMVFVLSVMLLAAWALEPTPLPAGQPAAIAVEQPAPVALDLPAPSLAVPAALQSDAFWLGVILALLLALASVYVRWAVLEHA